jgi:hypothetical protein
MNRVAGGAEFWNRVKTTPSFKAQRQAQFEKYNQLPSCF